MNQDHKHVIQLRFDGGCSPNPGRKYGSYEIRLDGKVLKTESRFQLGHGTNNEAEFESLIRGINAVKDVAWSAGLYKQHIRVAIITDSTIVRNHLMRKQKVPKQPVPGSRRMAMLAYGSQCKNLLADFHSFDVEWRYRDENVCSIWTLKL